MDGRLVAWARAVKARRSRRRPGAATRPVLWLFTDAERLPDPLPTVRRLPKGLCGVVLRHDRHPERSALGRRLARLCRARGIALSVAGDARLARALGAGLHLRRGGRTGVGWPRCRFTTSSAHSLTEVLRARRAGAALVFLSPCFPTDSHPRAPALGPLRWAAIVKLSRAADLGVLALGGISGLRARELPRSCAGAGAISALATDGHCGLHATVFRNCHGIVPGSVARK